MGKLLDSQQENAAEHISNHQLNALDFWFAKTQKEAMHQVSFLLEQIVRKS